MPGYTSETWIDKSRREQLGHVVTTADLIAHLEQVFVKHRAGHPPTSTALTVLLAHIIDHIWSVPNFSTPPVPEATAGRPPAPVNTPSAKGDAPTR